MLTRCTAWPPCWTFLLPTSSCLSVSNLDHRFSSICCFPPHSTPPRLSFPFPLFHRCRLSLSSLSSRAHLSGRADSFVFLFLDGSSVWNIWNLQIAKLQISYPAAFVSSLFFLRLPRLDAVCLAPKPNLSGGSNEDASTPLSTHSRRDDRFSVESSSFFGGSSVPAGFLQRTYTQQTGPQFTDGAEDTENTAKGSSHSQHTRQAKWA